MPEHLTRGHKILGLKWFAKCGTRWQGSYRLIGTQARKPQHFIPPNVGSKASNIMDKDFKTVYNRIIYKYASIDVARRILNNKKLMFSNPNNFNDPFDCYEGLIDVNVSRNDNRIIIKDYLEPKFQDFPRNERREIMNDLINHPDKFKRFQKQFITNKKNQIGVSCFSMINDNILMWSHYAEKHKGVCLGFLLSPVQKDLYALYPVRYLKRIEPISCFSNLDEALKHWLLTKAYDWRYEKEIRAVSLEYNGLVEFHPTNLKEIYFGCKINKDNKTEFTNLIKNNYSHVEISQMSIDDNIFKLIK